MRSVPDVVVDADPAQGLQICEADTGGCPSGRSFGGTSFAAPEWAAYVANLNAMLGANLGNANLKLYPLAGTKAFHTAAPMGSDFAHVGLGSPDFLELRLGLTGQSPGPASTTESFAIAAGSNADGSTPADGRTAGIVQAALLDADGFPLSGKTVSLTANSGGAATISPAAAVSDNDGNVVFQIADLTVENVSLTATDTTDGTVLGSPALTFGVPPAASAGLDAFPSQVTADGVTSATITLTLQDSLSRPTPGKLITLSQTGNSIVVGPTPAVTDSNGQIVFTVTDQSPETVTYSAVDVTDNNLPFPNTGTVSFINGPENGCGLGSPAPGPGFAITPFATGFLAENFFFGNINFHSCPGADGLAFDASGNLYVSHLPTGNIYKFGTAGGVANSGTLVTTTAIGPGLGGITFGLDGRLYGARAATPGGDADGIIIEIDPSTGAVLRTVASALFCTLNVTTDPLSGDLFATSGCDQGPNTPIWRISNPSSMSPTTTVYANLPAGPGDQASFAPDGTLYAYAGGSLVQVSGTNGPMPPTVTPLNFNLTGNGLAPGGSNASGGAQFLIADSAASDSLPNALTALDLTTSPPTLQSVLANLGVGSVKTIGPDGCLYAAQGTAVFRVTDQNGACPFKSALPSLNLLPTTASPAQGSPQSLTAMFHYVTSPAGTPVFFAVTGANPQVQMVRADANGQASFTYTGVQQGMDTVTASATVNTSVLSSNQALLTWGPGTDSTFTSLNPSPKGGTEGQTANLSASLADVSQNPVIPLPGQTINFSAGGQSCNAVTNASGIATCQITASGTGLETQTATFAGTSQLNASSDSTGFSVVAAPAPVAGKLKVSPRTLNFGDVDVGADKTKSVKITNAGKVKKKSTPLPILIEMESGVTSPFAVTQTCDDDELGLKTKHSPPGSCEVSVTFAPTAAMKYTGTLKINDNLEPSFGQSVKLEGTGKEPKK